EQTERNQHRGIRKQEGPGSAQRREPDRSVHLCAHPPLPPCCALQAGREFLFLTPPRDLESKTVDQIVVTVAGFQKTTHATDGERDRRDRGGDDERGGNS